MKRKSLSFRYFENDGEIPEAGEDVFVGKLPKGIASVDNLFEALFNVLVLPGYFGFNWNALLDCLRDFHWIDEKLVVLVHEELPALPKGELWEYLDILYFCVNDWGDDEGHQLMVMFPNKSRNRVLEILD